MMKIKKGSNHSLNPNREATKGNARSKTTIKRLKVAKNYKPIRNNRGQIVHAAPFQKSVTSGTMARIEPNRKWFGNTRVIKQTELQRLKDYVREEKPGLVLLRGTKLPVSLLEDKKAKGHSLKVLDSHGDVFGKNKKKRHGVLEHSSYEALMENSKKQEMEWEADNIDKACGEGSDTKDVITEMIFKAGQSHRVWNELFKVLDSSDVILYVVDARDPMGTRSRYIENYIKKEAAHKQLIFVMNKMDLVPVNVASMWLNHLKQEYVTIAMRAGVQHSFGRGELISILRQSKANLFKDKQQISVGVIGYPNVGKSSIINTLRGKKVCKVAPIAGETKVWQYVTLFKKILLIDCPGVVYPEGATEAELVLKGVVRVEKLKCPDLYISALLERVQMQHLINNYDLGDDTKFDTPEEFLELVARKTGKLCKGGEPNIEQVAKMVLNDFQRGKLPFHTRPPCTENADKNV